VGSGKLFGKRLNAVKVYLQGRQNAEKLTDEHLLHDVFDEFGIPQEGFADTSWAFIEVGQFTTEFALVDRGFNSCARMRIAVQILQCSIFEAHKFNITLSTATDLLANPSLRANGRRIDVSDLAYEAVNPLVNTIANKAIQFFDDDALSLSGVFVAGGGASIVCNAMAEKWSVNANSLLPHDFVSVMQDSRFPVAEGFLHFALGLHLFRFQQKTVLSLVSSPSVSNFSSSMSLSRILPLLSSSLSVQSSVA
jgi:hypothetical protein